ncbi:MAG: PhzF family phenazine biosynthesis protein [Acidobacteria bacterium]|nr:PhzF family phenazine biosynthesis protein [Acidobacteriota bacterium]
MRILLVDASAARPFSGNPAAMVPLEEPATVEWTLAVAAAR